MQKQEMKQQSEKPANASTSSNDSELLGMLLVFIGSACWGFSATCVSFLTDRCGVDVLWLADTRLFFAGALFLVAALIHDRSRITALFKSKSLVAHLIAYALIAVVLMQISYMNAIKYTNAGTALLLMETSVPIVLVYECLVARRPPSAFELVAIALAFAGVLAIATQGNLGSLGINALGLVFGLLAAVANAGYILLSKRLVSACGTLATNAAGMLVAAVVLAPFGRPWQVPPEMDTAGWIAFAAIILVGTMLAYGAFSRGVTSAGTVKASLIGVFEPVSGAACSALWLGTIFSSWDLIGGVLIIAMMIMVALRK